MMRSESTPGFEVVSCNLCGETQTRPFTGRNSLRVVQCTRCGLVYVNPRYDAAFIYQHYNSGQSSRMQYYLDVEIADRRTFAEILDLTERLSPAKGKVLDIGPNIGTFLHVARERGWDAYGVEINDEAARYCREMRGLNVISGVLDEGTYPKNNFDIIWMGDVIEHLRDPLALMMIVRDILKPGGAVIISTPDIGGWAARILQVKPEEHLYYFSHETIKALLERAELEVLGVKCLDRYRNLTAMTHSTTCGGLFQRLAPAFALAHRVIGDLVLKLPIRENLIAIARKPVALRNS